jgi:hypothetical protein
MKKKNLKSLSLNKKSISKFNEDKIKGGSILCHLASVLVCKYTDHPNAQCNA